MLTGEAKKLYQRKYMRTYMRVRRNGVTTRQLRGKVVPSRYCEACGESRAIENHHIDKSHDNNTTGNLIDLCPTCHTVLHKYNLSIDELLYKQPVGVGVKTLEILDKAMAETSSVNRGSFAQYVDADGNPVYDD